MVKKDTILTNEQRKDLHKITVLIEYIPVLFDEQFRILQRELGKRGVRLKGDRLSSALTWDSTPPSQHHGIGLGPVVENPSEHALVLENENGKNSVVLDFNPDSTAGRSLTFTFIWISSESNKKTSNACSSDVLTKKKTLDALANFFSSHCTGGLAQRSFVEHFNKIVRSK